MLKIGQQQKIAHPSDWHFHIDKFTVIFLAYKITSENLTNNTEKLKYYCKLLNMMLFHLSIVSTVAIKLHSKCFKIS